MKKDERQEEKKPIWCGFALPHAFYTATIGAVRWTMDRLKKGWLKGVFNSENEDGPKLFAKLTAPFGSPSPD